jgi:DNA-binding MarR family transcriptional regulator
MRSSQFNQSELFLLHEIVVRFDRIARIRILGPRRVTYPEFLLLMATRELAAPTQDEVAYFLDMSKSLVSQRVASLLKKKLIVQTPDPENRRQVKLHLTDRGRKLVEDVYEDMERSSAALFDSLQPARKAFRENLAQLAQELAREEGSHTSRELDPLALRSVGITSRRIDSVRSIPSSESTPSRRKSNSLELPKSGVMRRTSG